MPLPRPRSNTFYSNSFLIFIIRFFPSLANLLVMIWFSRHLPGSVYGQYQNFWVQLLVLSPIICFGIHVLLVTYSKEQVVTLFKKLSTRQFILYGTLSVAISVLFAILENIKLHLEFGISFLFILSFAWSFIFESFLIVFTRFRTLIFVNVLYSVIFSLIHWRYLVVGFPLSILFFFLSLLALLRFLVYALTSYSCIKSFTPLVSEEVILTPKIRSLWLHLGMYDILQVLFSYIDKFIISLVLTTQLSAIYYNGSQNIPFLPLLLSAAGSAVLLQLASDKLSDNNNPVISLMNQSGKLLSSIVFPVFFYLLFFRYELIVKLFTEKYIPAVPVFFMAILVLPVRAYNFTTVLQRHHKGNIINAGAVADLVLACALMYPLYKWMGLPGVAFSFVITTYLQAAFYLYHSGKLLNTNPLNLIPYSNWVVKLIVFASLFIGIHYVCKTYFTGWITLILGGVMLLLIILGSLLIDLKKEKQNVGTR